MLQYDFMIDSLNILFWSLGLGKSLRRVFDS